MAFADTLSCLAPVAQRIEQWVSTPCVRVRFLPGVLRESLARRTTFGLLAEDVRSWSHLKVERSVIERSVTAEQLVGHGVPVLAYRQSWGSFT